MSEPTDDDGEYELFDDDPDCCDWCGAEGCPWSSVVNGEMLYWCGQCDRDKPTPARLTPSAN